MGSGTSRTFPRTRAVVVAAVAFCALAASLAAARVHAEPVPCRRLEVAAAPPGERAALPVVALPGRVHDLGGAVPDAFRFERELGGFRMRYTLAPEETRWGVGRATLADARACDAQGLGADVPTPSSDLVVRRAPGDVYVLTAGDAPAGLDVPFRSVPAGSRLVWTGLGPAALAAVAFAAL